MVVLVARGLFATAALAVAGAWGQSVELDAPSARRFLPNDPLFPQQWSFDDGRDADVDAPEAWAITRGTPEIVIAVLDDGVELHHPDLVANIVSAADSDFTVDPPAATAEPGAAADRHGTAVAGIAAARGDNGIGMTGMCPFCRLLPIRVDRKASFATAAAFRYALAHGADVINLSWGYARAAPSAEDAAIREAIAAAALGRDGRGTLVVVAATNDAVDNCTGATLDLAALDGVLAVSVADQEDRVGGAGYGACIDLLASAKPQHATTRGVLTTDRTGLDGYASGDYHETFGGTSAAAPLVAGTAGLLLALNPELTRAELQSLLEQTADKIDAVHAAYDARGFSTRAGFGRLNAARALVPGVTITVAPSAVQVGEPFAVTVTASAPFGLESLWWSAVDSPALTASVAGRRALAGEVVRSVTWTDLTIAVPGTFVLGADARDRRHSRPLPNYPHVASQTGRAASATITVIERGEHDSR
jgi:subtilisin family serine protease